MNKVKQHDNQQGALKSDPEKLLNLKKQLQKIQDANDIVGAIRFVPVVAEYCKNSKIKRPLKHHRFLVPFDSTVSAFMVKLRLQFLKEAEQTAFEYMEAHPTALKSEADRIVADGHFRPSEGMYLFVNGELLSGNTLFSEVVHRHTDPDCKVVFILYTAESIFG